MGRRETGAHLGGDSSHSGKDSGGSGGPIMVMEKQDERLDIYVDGGDDGIC